MAEESHEIAAASVCSSARHDPGAGEGEEKVSQTPPDEALVERVKNALREYDQTVVIGSFDGMARAALAAIPGWNVPPLTELVQFEGPQAIAFAEVMHRAELAELQVAGLTAEIAGLKESVDCSFAMSELASEESERANSAEALLAEAGKILARIADEQSPIPTCREAAAVHAKITGALKI